MSSGLHVADAMVAGAAQAVRRACQRLRATQTTEGYWLEGVTAEGVFQAEAVLLDMWRGATVRGGPVAAILDRQLQDGGWALYPGGASEISSSVRAYIALKACGMDPNSAPMERARERIRAFGGLHAASTHLKLNLSILGLYPRERAPNLPPEALLLGNAIYFVSAWIRATVVALSVVQSAGDRRQVNFTLDELLVEDHGAEENLLRRALRIWERRCPKSLRRSALRKAEQWIIRRTRYSHGLAALHAPMLHSILAMDVLAYGPDHPDRMEAEREFERLFEDGRFQPWLSPVTDTALAVLALGEAGARAEWLEGAAEWLMAREARRKGDWSVKRRDLEPSGWYVQFANEFYPSIDATALVLLALLRTPKRQACEQRAANWLIGMQSGDGGWAAFDVDEENRLLRDIPEELRDRTSPDITGRVLEALGAAGTAADGAAMRRGVKYLERTQEQDGSWRGRWGVNYIYGTSLALRGLRAAGESDREAHILRGGEWLRSIQNADGGWGESCASYRANCFVPADSTPSQTAWAVLGLLAGGDAQSISVQKGIEYLVETQRDDGSWVECAATGTGIPGILYTIHSMYPNTFPVLALAEFRSKRGERA